MTVVERISALHRQLCEDPEYRKYLTAQNDRFAVEGALYLDTFMAAKMLQAAAGAAGDAELAGDLQLRTIFDAINKHIGRRIDPEANANVVDLQEHKEDKEEEKYVEALNNAVDAVLQPLISDPDFALRVLAKAAGLVICSAFPKADRKEQVKYHGNSVDMVVMVNSNPNKDW